MFSICAYLELWQSSLKDALPTPQWCSWILEPSCIIFLVLFPNTWALKCLLCPQVLPFVLELVYRWISFMIFWPWHYRYVRAGAREQGVSSQSQVQQEMWQSRFTLDSNNHTKQSAIPWGVCVKGRERERKTGRTFPSDCENSGTARSLQLSLLSMHMMHLSSEHKSCEKLQNSAGSCSVTCNSAGQLCLVHRSTGDGWRSWGQAVTEREVQTFPLEKNEPETRCELLQWDCNAL